MKKLFIYIVGIFAMSILMTQFMTNVAIAQSVPSPGAKQEGAILIKNATIHVGTGEVIENGYLGFYEGEIILLSDARTAKIDMSHYPEVIDAAGKDVYPGIIAADTYIGLTEIDAVRATRDNREVGSINPNARALIAYNTDSRVTPTIRSNGVLMAQVAPVGGRISGTSSVVHFDAWNWEDAALKEDDGIHLNWPRIIIQQGWWAEPAPPKGNDKYDNQIADLKTLFAEAKAYAETNNPPVNQKLAAMSGLFNGKQKLYVYAYYAKELLSVIDFKNETGIDIVLVGANDAWKVADEIKTANIPVILSDVHQLPDSPESDVDEPYRTPAKLFKAGVKFAITQSGGWEIRNIPFHAGTAVAYGLPYEEAIKAITANMAEILGLDNVGTLELGKDATIVISEGDLLDMRTSNVQYAFIQGRKVNLTNKQKQLAEKFRAKYKAQN